MADKISPGRFPAKVKDYGIKPPREAGKAPQAQIVFEFADSDGQAHEYSWFGSFATGKAREITLKTLITCGLVSNLGSGQELIAFNRGAGSGQLDESKELEIKVSMKEKWGSTTGEVVPNIDWVNEPGGAAVREKMADGDLVQVMSGLNLGGEIAALKQLMPAPKPQGPPNMAPTFPPAPTFDGKQEIPF